MEEEEKEEDRRKGGGEETLKEDLFVFNDTEELRRMSLCNCTSTGPLKP